MSMKNERLQISFNNSCLFLPLLHHFWHAVAHCGPQEDRSILLCKHRSNLHQPTSSDITTSHWDCGRCSCLCGLGQQVWFNFDHASEHQEMIYNPSTHNVVPVTGRTLKVLIHSKLWGWLKCFTNKLSTCWNWTLFSIMGHKNWWNSLFFEYKKMNVNHDCFQWKLHVLILIVFTIKASNLSMYH